MMKGSIQEEDIVIVNIFAPNIGTSQYIRQQCACMLSRFRHVWLFVTPMDCSPPGSPVPGILQARTLEWVAISFSNAWKWKVKGKSLSRVWLLATPGTTAYQGSSIHEIFQARVLEWCAIAFSGHIRLDEPNWYLQDIPSKCRIIHFLKGAWNIPWKRPHLGSQKMHY